MKAVANFLSLEIFSLSATDETQNLEILSKWYFLGACFISVAKSCILPSNLWTEAAGNKNRGVA